MRRADTTSSPLSKKSKLRVDVMRSVRAIIMSDTLRRTFN